MYTAKKVPVLPTPALQWTRIVPEKQVGNGGKGGFGDLGFDLAA